MCKTSIIYEKFGVSFQDPVKSTTDAQDHKHNCTLDWLGAAWRHFQGPMVTELAPGRETLGKDRELIMIGKDLLLRQLSSHFLCLISEGELTAPVELCYLH